MTSPTRPCRGSHAEGTKQAQEAHAADWAEGVQGDVDGHGDGDEDDDQDCEAHDSGEEEDGQEDDEHGPVQQLDHGQGGTE